MTLGAVEDLESEAGEALSSRAVKQIDRLLSVVDVDDATPQEAAAFWSGALSQFAQLCSPADGDSIPWTADRVLAMIEADGHADHFLTRPEVLLFFERIKRTGLSDENILSIWETIVYPNAPTRQAWDVTNVVSFTDMESTIVKRNAALSPAWGAPHSGKQDQDLISSEELSLFNGHVQCDRCGEGTAHFALPLAAETRNIHPVVTITGVD